MKTKLKSEHLALPLLVEGIVALPLNIYFIFYPVIFSYLFLFTEIISVVFLITAFLWMRLDRKERSEEQDDEEAI